jgi:hypothetical protein
LQQGWPVPSEIIPDNRLAPWEGNVGVPGGIPTRTTIFRTITPSGGDDAPTIQSAMNACPAGQVVLLSAGTFTIGSGMTFFGGTCDNKTLRGAGQGQTILHITSPSVPFYMRGISAWPPITTGPVITAGATKGSTTITMADTSSFGVGQIFHVAPETQIWAHNLGGFDSSTRQMGRDFRVVSKTSATVTFEPPMPFDYSAMNPMAMQMGSTTLSNTGLESFTIDLRDTQADSAIKSERTFGCWYYDLEIKNPYTRYTIIAQAVRCEVRRCYLHDTQGAGPNHEGLDFGQSSWNLVEDNMFSNAGAMAIIFGDGAGKGFCNVIA